MSDILAPRRKVERRPTNVTLPESLQREAKELKVNVSHACEQGLAQAVAVARRQLWLDENRAAIAAYNTQVEQTEPVLAAYRQF